MLKYENYHKYVDLEGNMVYYIPYDSTFENIEKYINFPEDRFSEHLDKDLIGTSKFDELVRNYLHIRRNLFGNNLTFENQSFESLHDAYIQIMGGIDNKDYIIDNKDYIIDSRKSEDYLRSLIRIYVNDLTLLVTLDNTNKRMINRLSDFDLSLFKDIPLEESTIFKNFGSVYDRLDKILSLRYNNINKKYDNIVDNFINKNGMVNTTHDLYSKFNIRDINSLEPIIHYVNEVKHVVDPLTGDKYIFININEEEESILVPFKENLNFRNTGENNENITDILKKYKI